MIAIRFNGFLDIISEIKAFNGDGNEVELEELEEGIFGMEGKGLTMIQAYAEDLIPVNGFTFSFPNFGLFLEHVPPIHIMMLEAGRDNPLNFKLTGSLEVQKV